MEEFQIQASRYNLKAEGLFRALRKHLSEYQIACFNERLRSFCQLIRENVEDTKQDELCGRLQLGSPLFRTNTSIRFGDTVGSLVLSLPSELSKRVTTFIDREISILLEYIELTR